MAAEDKIQTSDRAYLDVGVAAGTVTIVRKRGSIISVTSPIGGTLRVTFGQPLPNSKLLPLINCYAASCVVCTGITSDSTDTVKDLKFVDAAGLPASTFGVRILFSRAMWESIFAEEEAADPADTSLVKIFDFTSVAAMQNVDIPIPSFGDQLIVWMKNTFASPCIYSFRPNASTANLTQLYNEGNNGVALPAVTTNLADYYWMVTGGAGGLMQGWLSMDLTAGAAKAIFANGIGTNGSAVQRENYPMGMWQNAARPVSARIAASDAAGIGAGTRIVAWIRTF